MALVDAEGHVLAAAGVAAEVQDRDTLSALMKERSRDPALRLAIPDGAFTAERFRECYNIHGMCHRIVEMEPDQKGFIVLERRWVVERTFRWLGHWGSLRRERTGRLACVASLMEGIAPNNPSRNQMLKQALS